MKALNQFFKKCSLVIVLLLTNLLFTEQSVAQILYPKTKML